MRILAVNHLPPHAAHIGGRRVSAFADALATRGHRVVLMTGADTPSAPPAWDDHDWNRPLHLGCPACPSPFLARARVGGLPSLLNKAVLGAHYWVNGGVYGDWVAGTRPHWRNVVADFRPDIVWATFGNTGAWIIARAISRLAGCPWVLDLKDNWERYVPASVRAVTTRRFGDAAAATALSEGHAAQIERWFGRRATVVYSGLPIQLLGVATDIEDQITLTGSVYDPGSLAMLFDGIAAWAKDRGGAKPVLSYFGGDGDTIAAMAARLDGACTVRIEGYRPLEELHAALRRARINAYIRTDKVLFHHKIFELLGAGRPILCVPGECAETKRIVASVDGQLFSCPGVEHVRVALDSAWNETSGAVAFDRLGDYAWEGQAAILERVLCDAVSG